MNDRNYYAILGVSRSVEEVELRQAYVRKLKDIHPDLAKPSFYPQPRVEDLQRAYQCLRDPASRSAHDADLRAIELARYAHLKRMQRRLTLPNSEKSKPPYIHTSHMVLRARSRWKLVLLISAMAGLIIKIAQLK